MRTAGPSRNWLQVLEAQCARSPRQAALRGAGDEITYRELAGRVDELARDLVESGVRPGECVAVMLGNGGAFLVAVFASWKAGAVVCPLHVKFREQEVARQLEDVQARVLILDRGSAGLAKAVAGRELPLRGGVSADSRAATFSLRRSPAGPVRAGLPDVPGSAPALTQFTSGSSGRQKRVVRTHEQLLAEAAGIQEALGLGAGDRILAAVPMFHSYGFGNVLLSPIVTGATIVAMEEFAPRDAARLIEREGVTVLPGVPFMYQHLAELRGSVGLPSLRWCISAGAPLPAATAAAFERRYRRSIAQLYGTTETGVITVNRGEDWEKSAGSVGTPVAGVEVRVADEAGVPLPAGAVGSVMIRSRSAARGYETPAPPSASRFSGDWFFPGDLGRMDETGRLELVGRRQPFINVAGNKVDPGEIEEVLRGLASVVDVAVVGVPDDASGEQVKAVIVAGAPILPSDVQAHCRARLAEFKVPRTVEFRPELPRSPLGKLLRARLID